MLRSLGENLTSQDFIKIALGKQHAFVILQNGDIQRPLVVPYPILLQAIASSINLPAGSAAWGSILPGTGVGSQADLIEYLDDNYYPLNDNPASYVTASQLTTALLSYVTTSALTTALLGYVPTSRTITINGVAYDLSADRSWTVSGGGGITALTGDVTASGTGSVAATIAANAVTFAKMQNIATQKLLGRGTAATGNVEEIGLSAAFSIDGSNNLQYANAALVSLYGSGVDGDVTISVNTTLARDMYYNNLTVNSGVTLNTNGFKVYVRSTLTNDGTIGTVGNNGTNGVSFGSAGVGGAATNFSLALNSIDIFINGSPAGTNGGLGSSTNGASSGAVTYNAVYLGGKGGVGGQGGTGPGGTRGSGGAINTTFNGIDAKRYINALTESFMMGLVFPASSVSGTGGGAGAGGGAGTGGGSGGGGGSGCKGVNIHAFQMINTGTIRAIGGNGGNGSAPTGANAGGGAGGGGGGGGFMYLIYGSLANTGTITVAGGTGGTGAAGVGTGTAGANGANGGDGTIVEIDTTLGTITQT